ncbi:brg1-associated factor b [Coprinopsis cinerea okayama7|uniref:Brg1-associated factor b n=1 Tax=Coprinopsis cinerea (strain Okayama-7 / 130 / ATCC MYA-4618 / FGSC 9003) TaxID=240176 RepID=A8NWR3_COPC7|nr:brg1-associated factor b [Coprinopsis cinerea okayama7\|eukprot:XP_001836964.1 brg1-associated factor b [Coprinopsis cinerea okayama7\
MVNYGGDEVSALVIDIGTSSLRAGYAGDDTPKAIIPTSYGYIPAPPEADVPMGDGTGNGEQGSATNANEGSRKFAQMFLGQNGPSMWRPGMEIGNPLVDGLIQDFNPITPLIRNALEDVLRVDATEHPILVTEPTWNTPANRERMAEIMFEEFQVPAFYIANTGVLNAFAAGKGSALVIDIGQSMASVTPVVDGFVLRKGLAYTPLPRFIHALSKNLLINQTPVRPGIELWPHQLIATKSPVDIGQQPIFTLRQDRLAQTTESWRLWAEAKEVDEWIQTVAAVSEQGWNDQLMARSLPKQYEFPTGYAANFGPERYQIGEHLFLPNNNNPNQPKTIPALVTESLRACDPELRQVLMGNIVLTGGGSLFTGLADRLNAEMSRTFPHTKIHAPGNPVERRYGGWLGGSILASLGTFHQLWISKEEWQEHGKAIVGQRCK